MNRMIFAAALLLLGFAARAEDMVTSPGQPFCFKRDDLFEYLKAMIQKDERWMKELDCRPIVGGAKVAVIEDYPSDSDIGHVVKVRVFSTKGAGSVVGFTLNLGIKPK